MSIIEHNRAEETYSTVDSRGQREREDGSRRSAAATRTGFWPPDLILGLMPLLLSLQALFWIAYFPAGLHGLGDFRQLYAGGYMVRTGHAKQLYDYESQRVYEDEVAGGPIVYRDGTPTMLPINHLAFVELLFAPLSLFPYRTAYCLFLTFNIALLIVCLRLLRGRMQFLSDRWRWFPVLMFAAFYPIMRALTQGQDSIILLTLFAGALWSLDRNRELTAGVLIGAGLFKFQIAIPVALLFLLWRRWRFVLGFALSSIVAGSLSLWLVGFAGARQYRDTMMAMSVHLVSKSDMIRYVTMPTAMFNLRGLISALMRGLLPQSGIQIVILVFSLLVIWAAAKRTPSLPLAVTAACLVSYHFFAHDASIFIVPIIAAFASASVLEGIVATLLFVLPAIDVVGMLGKGEYGYVVAMPLAVLFFLFVRSDHGLSGGISDAKADRAD